ncbi:GGDEF domain-containing protein [Alteromonas sediminis]|uniref:GGDEF domain-containing protein n=1 Tax=Alteromonas sediminis TaxID=2259342 RepID=A0A3N5XZD8_9ALTE|nr:GGDEF domain-containing protein [Alteromonas sediminis]RPJ65436.1 GGDEF domain-containing protein [Alteromonas sediminis]
MFETIKYKIIKAWNSVLFRLIVKDQRNQYSAASATYEELSSTLSAIPDLMFELDANGRHWDVRVLRPELLVAPAEKLLGKTVKDVMPPEAANLVMQALAETKEKGFSHGTQIKLPTPLGERWFEVSMARKEKDGSEDSRFIVLSRDINERKIEFLKTEKLAYLDRLTELPNRHALNDELIYEITKSNPGGHYAGLLFVDLDEFKKINDAEGHHIGDQLLKAVAKRLRSAIREDDLVVRWGGDEFVVLIKKLSFNHNDAQHAAILICEKITESITKPYSFNSKNYYCSVSIGITLFNQPQHDLLTLIQQADSAMYSSKKSQDQRFAFF